MPEFASELLRTLVRRKPERVWDALTATGIPLGYLYGMTVEPDWRPGTSVTMTLGDQARLTGDVLVAERPRRLSYTLGDRPGQPSVYDNWELRALGHATIVRLHVDEPWPDADPADDLETAWLPVLYGLVAYLDGGVGRFPSGRDLPDPPGLGSQQSAWTRPLRSRATRRAGWAGPLSVGQVPPRDLVPGWQRRPARCAWMADARSRQMLPSATLENEKPPELARTGAMSCWHLTCTSRGIWRGNRRRPRR